MIRPILCEGKNDRLFLDELLRNVGIKSPFSLHGDFTRLDSFYRWGCKGGQPCIIISDDGHDLINKYVPLIIRRYFGKSYYDWTPETLHYIVLKDSDGSDHKYLLDNYRNSISSTIQAANVGEVSFYLDEKDYTITLTSKKDDRYSFQFHFVFIPPSFEKCLVAKSFEKNRQLSKYKDDIERMDPHDALTEIAKHLGIDKESLIRNSVSQGWFCEEDWYMSLGQFFCDYLNISPNSMSVECSG